MAVIDSRRKWNDTHFDVVEGVAYQFETQGTWTDWTIECDANGYSRFYLAPFSFLKRVPAAQWFQLIASVDQQATQTLILRKSGKFTAPATGRLWAYANDAPFAYNNNQGSITLLIQPVHSTQS